MKFAPSVAVIWKARTEEFTATSAKESGGHAKGMRTKDYIIKRKLMLYVHQIKIKEV